MRAFSWVPLLGLLAALAAAQDQPLTEPDSVSGVQESPSHKTSSTGGILETVQALVASVAPSAENPPPADSTDQNGAKLGTNPAAGDETHAVTVEEVVAPLNPTEAEEPTAVLTDQPEEGSPANNKDKGNNNQVKLVKVYNKVADNVLRVLSSSLSDVEPLPINLGDDVALTALDESTPTPEPEPEPEAETGSGGQTKSDRKRKNGNKKRKNKKNRRNKNKNKNQTADVEESDRKANKKNKRNKNKANKNQEEDEEVNIKLVRNKNKKKNNNNAMKNQEGVEETEEGEKVKPARNKNNKRNKNKRKNKKNKRRKNKKNKNKKNKKESKSEDIEVSREAKALEEDDEETEQALSVREGRRKGSDRMNNRKRGNNRKNKNRKNKRNKNKKNKNGAKQKVESREDHGPIYPSPEERSASNAYLTGLTSLSRVGDVDVDASGKAVLVNVKVQAGPMFVHLSDAARALTKSHVSTTLEANMQFRIRNKGRGRQIIKLNDLTMTGPTEVTVARLDMPLEADVVSAAKDEVRQAVDVGRLSRIFKNKLETIFEKDNVVQNLEHHELLKM